MRSLSKPPDVAFHKTRSFVASCQNKFLRQSESREALTLGYGIWWRLKQIYKFPQISNYDYYKHIYIYIRRGKFTLKIREPYPKTTNGLTDIVTFSMKAELAQDVTWRDRAMIGSAVRVTASRATIWRQSANFFNHFLPFVNTKIWLSEREFGRSNSFPSHWLGGTLKTLIGNIRKIPGPCGFIRKTRKCLTLA